MSSHIAKGYVGLEEQTRKRFIIQNYFLNSLESSISELFRLWLCLNVLSIFGSTPRHGITDPSTCNFTKASP